MYISSVRTRLITVTQNLIEYLSIEVAAVTRSFIEQLHVLNEQFEKAVKQKQTGKSWETINCIPERKHLKENSKLIKTLASTNSGVIENINTVIYTTTQIIEIKILKQ